MGAFDDKHWNLSQAAAWVVYRRRDLVEAFEHQSDYGFASLKVYPMPDGAMAAPVGSIVDLERALQAGRIKTLGRRQGGPSAFFEIPAREWVDLSIRPPRVIRHHPVAGRTEPWHDLVFESAELKRLWRSESEVSGRTMHNWGALQAIYEELQIENPDFTQNELVKEIQGTYRDRFNRKPPAESTIKDRIRRWRVAGRPV